MEENNQSMPAEETTAMEAAFEAEFEKTAEETQDSEILEGEDAAGESGGLEDDLEKDGFVRRDKTEEETSEEEQSGKYILDGKEYTEAELKEALSRRWEAPDILRKLARQAGMDVESYLQFVEDNAMQRQIDARVQQLLEQDVPEEIAQHFARMEQENARMKEESDRKAQTDARDEKMRMEIEAFHKKFPDVQELPSSVIETITKTGATPVEAYQQYLIQKQEMELKTLRQEKKNRGTTPGSVKGTAEIEADPFLREFMKD